MKSSEIQSLQTFRDGIQKEKVCRHVLWYYIDDATDPYEQRPSWRCFCAACGIEQELDLRDHRNDIICGSHCMGYGERASITYRGVTEVYRILKQAGFSEEKEKEIMISIFNNRKDKDSDFNEKARCILLHYGLDQKLIDEIINTIVDDQERKKILMSRRNA